MPAGAGRRVVSLAAIGSPGAFNEAVKVSRAGSLDGPATAVGKLGGAAKALACATGCGASAVDVVDVVDVVEAVDSVCALGRVVGLNRLSWAVIDAGIHCTAATHTKPIDTNAAAGLRP